MPDADKVSTLSCQVAGAELVLHPLKAIWYKERNSLIVSDVHLGKTNHFRKSGIAIPDAVETTNFERLDRLFDFFNPDRVIFLGDLFHSHLNTTWTEFEDLLKSNEHISFDLVMGNHDILPDAVYGQSLLNIFQEIKIGPFLLTHHPKENWTSKMYNLSGHLHPAVILKGKARQYLRLPCFYFKKNQGILPAFGAFTGMCKMNADEAEQIYIASESGVRRVK